MGKPYRIDLTGLKFNRLEVIGYSHNSENHGAIWDCVCDCGKPSKVASTYLSKGITKSCGCLRYEMSKKKVVTHGKSKTPLYNRWVWMKYRCDNPTFPRYGERGIKYESSWGKFENFEKDMGESFKESLELDRIDVDGDYCKENCRWVGGSESSYNRDIQCNNVSGRTGVYWMESRSRYYARIQVSGKSVHLGCFTSFDEAVAAREGAELKYYGYIKR